MRLEGMQRGCTMLHELRLGRRPGAGRATDGIVPQPRRRARPGAKGVELIIAVAHNRAHFAVIAGSYAEILGAEAAARGALRPEGLAGAMALAQAPGRI